MSGKYCCLIRGLVSRGMCTALAHGEWFGARRDLGKMGRVQPHEKAAEIGFGEEAGQKQNKTKQKQNKTKQFLYPI